MKPPVLPHPTTGVPFPNEALKPKYHLILVIMTEQLGPDRFRTPFVRVPERVQAITLVASGHLSDVPVEEKIKWRESRREQENESAMGASRTLYGFHSSNEHAYIIYIMDIHVKRISARWRHVRASASVSNTVFSLRD
jgi:hypothetical protein